MTQMSNSKIENNDYDIGEDGGREYGNNVGDSEFTTAVLPTIKKLCINGYMYNTTIVYKLMSLQTCSKIMKSLPDPSRSFPPPKAFSH